MTSVKALQDRLNAPLGQESCYETFRLMLQTMNHKDATDELVKAAIKRHHRTICLHEHREKEAA